MSSLKNLRVLNTRPPDQGKALSQAIINGGGVSVDCPAIIISPIESSLWLKPLQALRHIDIAIFTSANAVSHSWQWICDLPKIHSIIAIGKATAEALEKRGVIVDHIPSTADSEHILELPLLKRVSHKTIALFKGVGGRTLIADTLAARGALLQIATVYQRSLPKVDEGFLHLLWQNDSVDIILFTSQQGMQNIFTLFGRKARAWLCSKPCLVLSNRLAKEAKALGIHHILISAPDAILLTLQHFNQGLVHGHRKH